MHRNKLRVAIMQPYFLPYLGYFQLISSVDIFVIYDNIKYTKKGWINRNRILVNGRDEVFSLPLMSDSDSLHVCNRKITSDFSADKLLNKFKGAYSKAPYFKSIFPVLEDIIKNKEDNLFEFIYYSLVKVLDYLDIQTKIVISSTIDVDHTLIGQEKVLAICRAVGAGTYVNAIGGMDLYKKRLF